MIAQASERVARLALVAGNALGDESDSLARRGVCLKVAKREGARTLAERDLWPSYVAPTSLGNMELRGLIGCMAEACGAAALDEQTGIAMHRADSRARLPAIMVPTLVVAGAEDRVYPPGRGAEIAAAIPHSHLPEKPDASWLALPGIGHFVPLEATDALTCAFGR